VAELLAAFEAGRGVLRLTGLVAATARNSTGPPRLTRPEVRVRIALGCRQLPNPAAAAAADLCLSLSRASPKVAMQQQITGHVAV
jgi:hypothetical protein